MALSLNAADGCKYLSVIINYTATSTTVLGLNILDADGSSVAGTVAPTFTIVLTSQTGNAIPGGQESALLHCDIDCCLTKLTNELIDCACDCAKCASSLAKAQKVYLLITSADYAIIQANEGSDSARPGFIKDAKTKYLKAKEICDESCGCDC